ncbi:SCO family protein [Pelomonas sp. V22]|uniref:SCO family protein n=1 Tax=Pelomonas sp. V22 TaxID=2822139 RepID=UPI0024A83023|nr:SCO family protein [Pelomonas sp. V22]MDI4632550.1 SCO family protein [Pelomonas sp. V22]
MHAKRRMILALAAAATLGLAACQPAKTAFQGVDLTGADYAQDLKLPDVDGRERSLGDFKGKVLVIFFGYTQCPDVCPTTMAELAQVKKALGPDGERVQGIFVTVDPERDTPELLRAYLASFDKSFVALRGSPEQVKEAAKNFKVFFAKVPGKQEGSYTMDHTAASFLFDAAGRVRVFSRYGSGTQALTEDLKILLAEK